MLRRLPLAAIVSVLALVLISTVVPLPGMAQTQSIPSLSSTTPPSTLLTHPAIHSIWKQADGPVVTGEVKRAWLWGPSPVAAGMQSYQDSPTGTRQVVYYDKARLDIVDPRAPNDSLWYVQGAQLVTELLSGSIQLGNDTWVERGPANIPVTGDPGQTDAVTYATLGKVATLPASLRSGAAPPDAPARVGQEIASVLRPDGTVDSDGHRGSTVRVASYDEATRHNIAEPFQKWGESQVFPWLYILGHPLTEPYWVDTVVAGAPHRVLVQAFERRVLSYTPDNPTEWETEAGNVGQHYRTWRGLSWPTDPTLAPLATWVPFGEQIVGAAVANGVDPYLLAAIANAASGGDPLAVNAANGGVGLFSLRSGLAPETRDPERNATVAARELERLASSMPDERALLAAFYAGDGADPNAPVIAPFVNAVLAERDALRSRQAPPTSPQAVNQPIPLLATGSASVYPDAGGDWGSGSLAWYASWGGAVEGWAPDPIGHYCTHPDYAPGDRLRLVANGSSIDCTIAGRAADSGMLVAHGEGIIALNQPAFDRLGLGGNNNVRVFHLGPASGQRAGSARSLNTGAAAFYDPDYDRAWWDYTLERYAGWGQIAAGWSHDPNGYYCVYPHIVPGTRLRLVANGVTLDCTTGDMVANHDIATWQSRWAIEMSWDTFTALGLDGNNHVEVYVIE